MEWAPAATLNAAVVYGWYDALDGWKVPTMLPSTSTSKFCTPPQLPRRAAWKEMV